MDDKLYKERIARLNDLLRTTFIGGRVVITSGIRERGQLFESAVVEAVQKFKDFNEGNNPYGERDCAIVEVMDAYMMFKIDYYDKSMQFASEDPANPEVTTRVLTIMMADEY